MFAIIITNLKPYTLCAHLRFTYSVLCYTQDSFGWLVSISQPWKQS